MMVTTPPKKEIIVHIPIAHLRTLEGKERKEFMKENRDNIPYFIDKVHYNSIKIHSKLDNYQEQQFGGNILFLSGVITILLSGNQLLPSTKNSNLNCSTASGVILGIFAGLGLGYWGIKKIQQNSPSAFQALLDKNEEVIFWLQHNGYYDEKVY
jgi:hypothetical protein